MFWLYTCANCGNQALSFPSLRPGNGNNQLEHNDMALIEKGICCGVYVPANKIEFVFVYVVHNYAFFSTWCTIPLVWYV